MQLKRTETELAACKKHFTATEAKLSEEITEKKGRVITLNGEIQRLKRDHAVALEKLKEKIRWQTFNQAAAERQTALIKKQVGVRACVSVVVLLILYSTLFFFTGIHPD